MTIKLRGKLLVAFFVAALVPSTFLGFITLTLNEQALKQKTTDKMASDLTILKKSLENYIDTLKGSVSLQGGHNVASRTAMESFISAEPIDFVYDIKDKQFRSHFLSFMGTYEGVSEVTLAGLILRKGEQVGKLIYAAEANRTEAEEKNSKKVFEVEKVIQKTGDRYLHKGDPNPIARAFYSSLEANGPVILDFTALTKDEAPSLWMGVPIQVEESLKYYLPAERDEDEMGEEDDEVRVGSDHVGVLIAQIYPVGINKMFITKGEQKNYLVGEDASGEIVLRSFGDDSLENGGKLPEYLNQALAKGGIDSYKTDEGARRLVASAALDMAGLKWWLVSEVDEAVAFADITKLKWWIFFIGLLSTAVIIAIALFSITLITRPINQMVRRLKDIAEGEGDLTSRLEVKSNDEIGELSRWFNTFIDKLQGVFKEVAENISLLNSSSTELETVAQHMADGADQMSSRSKGLDSNSRQVQENMETVAAATEQLSANVGTVAAAVEEMSATINEVAHNSSNSSNIALKASEAAETAGRFVSELQKGAEEIDKVIEVIMDIADQTNLLALNATIEAARAGEAGKGFAVVAGEVKDLAKQTGLSTEDIRSKITNIQGSIEKTVDSISRIIEVIKEVNELSSGIAAATEQQSATVNEISQNIAQAASGANDVSTNTSNVAVVSKEMAGGISEVSAAVNETAQSADRVRSSSRELSRMAENLEGIVSQFKV